MNKNNSIDKKLAENGWTKRFVAGEPRLSEAVLAYEEIGFETRLEPLPKQDNRETCISDKGESECRICFEGHEDEYKIIYTRPKPGDRKNDFC